MSFDFTIANSISFYFFSFSFFLRSSDKEEKGKFLPEPSDPYFSKASFFSISSKSLILKFTFLFSKSNSEIAQSILSPSVNLDCL